MHYLSKKSFLFAVSHTVTYAAYKYTRSTFNWKFNLQWIRFVSLLSSIKTGYYVNYHILTEKYGHSAIIFNEYPHERKPISRGNLIFFEIRFTFFVCLYTFVIINNYYSFVTFFFFVNDLLIKLKVFLFFLDINALLYLQYYYIRACLCKSDSRRAEYSRATVANAPYEQIRIWRRPILAK